MTKPIANEYEALTEEALDICDYFMDLFKKYVAEHPDYAIRDLQYLATQGIGVGAAETAIRKGMAMRKAKRRDTHGTFDRWANGNQNRAFNSDED